MNTRQGNIAIPVLAMIGSVVLLVVVGYFSWRTFTGNNANSNSSLTTQNTNTGTSLGVPAPGYENVNEMVIVNSNTATSTNTQSDVPVGWKKHSNDEPAFSINYPDSWTVSELNGKVSFYGQGQGTPFTAPVINVYAKDTLYPDDSCLVGQSTISIFGVDRVRQIEGCAYAGSEVATFFKRANDFLVVSWTQDVPEQYSTYEEALLSFQFTE